MHCAVFQNKFELFEGLYNQMPVGEEAAGQMSTILWPIKLQTTTVHWVSVEYFVLFLSRRQLNIIFNGREKQHFVAFCSLWNFCPQRGLLERHLLDMRRKYLGERAISCSQFRTSPPRPGLFVWLGRVLLFTPWRPTSLPFLFFIRWKCLKNHSYGLPHHFGVKGCLDVMVVHWWWPRGQETCWHWLVDVGSQRPIIFPLSLSGVIKHTHFLRMTNKTLSIFPMSVDFDWLGKIWFGWVIWKSETWGIVRGPQSI